MAPHRAAQVRAARRDLAHRRLAVARAATRLAATGDEDLVRRLDVTVVPKKDH